MFIFTHGVFIRCGNNYFSCWTRENDLINWLSFMSLRLQTFWQNMRKIWLFGIVLRSRRPNSLPYPSNEILRIFQLGFLLDFHFANLRWMVLNFTQKWWLFETIWSVIANLIYIESILALTFLSFFILTKFSFNFTQVERL